MEFDFSPLQEGFGYLVGGLGITVLLAVLTVACSIVVGMAMGLGRVYGPRWLRWPIVFYIDTQRAIPVFVVLVCVYFAVPILTGLNFHPFWAALCALTLNASAYAAEIIRAGIESIRPGQVRAGLALGMSGPQIVRRIVLPQALVRMLPSFGSLLTHTIKDTAIAAVIAVPELMKRAETLVGQTYRPIEIFTAVMIVYFIILYPGSRLIDRLYQRVAHLGRS